MELHPNNQIKLYGFNETFELLKNLFDQKKIPNKILFSGQKGIGKATFAYHLSNYIFSKNEKYPYKITEYQIDTNNRSFNFVINNSHPNFFLIDLKDGKKNIEISQIREMINYTNKSSFNSNDKIIIIDNVEFLNTNSVNALLKVLEEPNEKIIFFLIHDNQKKISSTLKSRCIEFNLHLSNSIKKKIIDSLTEENFYNSLSNDFKNYYISPGQYINLYYYCQNNNLDFKNIDIGVFLKDLILNYQIKKSSFLRENLIQYIEFFFAKKFNTHESKNDTHNLYKKFIEKIYNIKKYNLDLETLLIEINSELINE